MHTELQAVFDEHEAPKHCCKRQAHDAIGPVVRLAAKAQQQVIEYRTLIAQAEVAPHDHALDGKMEMMHQTLGAMEREATALAAAARNLGQTHTQLERYMAEWKAEIARYEAATGTGVSAVAS